VANYPLFSRAPLILEAVIEIKTSSDNAKVGVLSKEPTFGGNSSIDVKQLAQ